MKKDIHPTTHMAKVTCNSCNATFDVLSTVDSFDVEVCSQCHPFYTGEQRIMDTAGRADKFAKRMAKAAALQSQAPAKKDAEKKEVPTQDDSSESESAEA
ncbi:50S ribosomal protein L31 [Candidatus Nomurabacteria bacterium]|nr:50S ribosomal protein L31 [Candidatus Nomurabacteria bacterium]